MSTRHQAPRHVQQAHKLQVINMTHIQQYQFKDSFPDGPTLPPLEQADDTTDTALVTANAASNRHQIGAQAQAVDIDHELNSILGINHKKNKNKKRQRLRTPLQNTNTNSHSLPPTKRRKVTITYSSAINNKNKTHNNNNKPLSKRHKRKKQQSKQHTHKLQETITNDIHINNDNNDDNTDWNELYCFVKQFSIKQDQKTKEKLDIIRKRHEKEIEKVNIEHNRSLQLIRNKMNKIQEKINNSKNTHSMLRNAKQIETELKDKNNALTNTNNELNDNIKTYQVENQSLSKSLDAGNQFIKQLLNKNKSLKTNIMACQQLRQNDEKIIDRLKGKLQEKQGLTLKLKEVEESNKMLVEWNRTSRNSIQAQSFEIEKYKKMQEEYEQIKNVAMEDMVVDNAADFEENIFEKKSVIDAMVWEENESGKMLKAELNNIIDRCNKEDVCEENGRLKFKDKYIAEKKKRKRLAEKIRSMKETDWKGEVIKEYKNEDGDTLYDMKWAISVGLTSDNLCDEDLEKWELQKKGGHNTQL